MTAREQRKRLVELVNGYRSTALLFAAVQSGLIDALGSGSSGVADIAKATGVDSDLCARVLCGLCVLGVVAQQDASIFTLTELGEGLLPDGGDAVREWALLSGAEYLPAWGAMLHSMKTGESAFEHVFGMSAWEHRKTNPSLQQAFQSWMSAKTAAAVDSVLRSYDFTGSGTLGDLGGGTGELLFSILEKHPALRGILMDQPQVIERLDLPERCTAVACDFFQSVPKGADTLILKSVLHDWADEECRTILRNCRLALPQTGRLLVIERLQPLRAADDTETVMLDLHMLAVLGGRERSRQDFERLFIGAGFRVNAVHPTDSGFQIFECECVAS